MTPFLDHVSSAATERPRTDACDGGGTAPGPQRMRHPARAVERKPLNGPGPGSQHHEGGESDGFRALHLKLPAALRAVPGARHRVRSAVTAWGWGDEADTVELLLCELLSNALKHATSNNREARPIGVRITHGHESLVVVVCDGGCANAQVEASARPGDLAEGGRGLLLVQSLASEWGSRRSAQGTSTWFALDRRGTD
ncbi:ATP-binding protein [Streptomyces curacoi]|uniref:ATP-binding protein n=1 Tax=Streptomyces curacoi TaxID=146536 RepID=UPI00099E327E